MRFCRRSTYKIILSETLQNGTLGTFVVSLSIVLGSTRCWEHLVGGSTGHYMSKSVVESGSTTGSHV